MIYFVHGANSTKRSFEYLKSQLPGHEFIDLEYAPHERPTAVVERVVETVSEPAFVVGHSLGGVIAVAAAQRTEMIEKVVTLASPLGGSEPATWMRWFWPDRLYAEIHPYSPIMVDVRKHPVITPTLSIVTTDDGVVSVPSQRALRGPIYVQIELNHFEVLLATEVPELINEFLDS